MVKKIIHLLAINGILWTAIGTKIAAIFLPNFDQAHNLHFTKVFAPDGTL